VKIFIYYNVKNNVWITLGCWPALVVMCKYYTESHQRAQHHIQNQHTSC
jgi:hypothetical protein